MMNTVLKCHNAYKMGAIYLYWYSDWKKLTCHSSCVRSVSTEKRGCFRNICKAR